MDRWQAAYEEETVSTSLTAGFSPALAQVVDPGSAHFTLIIRTQFIEAGNHAIALRDRTFPSVAAEVAELKRLQDDLEAVATLLATIQEDQVSFDRAIESIHQIRQRLDQLLATH